MRSTTLDLFFLTALVAGLVYLSVDAWFGPSGRAQREPLQKEISAIQREIDDIKKEHEALEKKAARLSGPEIDPELLDERLRANMGVVGKDEALIIAPADAKADR